MANVLSKGKHNYFVQIQNSASEIIFTSSHMKYLRFFSSFSLSPTAHNHNSLTKCMQKKLGKNVTFKSLDLLVPRVTNNTQRSTNIEYWNRVYNIFLGIFIWLTQFYSHCIIHKFLLGWRKSNQILHYERNTFTRYNFFSS